MTMKSHQVPYTNIRCLLIDLDNTLYPDDTIAIELLRKRIVQFLVEEMGITPAEATDLRLRLFKSYGTTLRGLQIEYQVDMKRYLNYIHDLPMDEILAPDPELDRMLHALPQRKVIFTNADRDHAQRVINILEVQGHFDRIIDIYDIYPYCKPEIEAFQKALTLIGEDPYQCLMVDDIAANLETAQSLGIKTVSVGQNRHGGSPHIPNIKALSDLIQS